MTDETIVADVTFEGRRYIVTFESTGRPIEIKERPISRSWDSFEERRYKPYWKWADGLGDRLSLPRSILTQARMVAHIPNEETIKAMNETPKKKKASKKAKTNHRMEREMTETKFNINHFIKVRLTDLGRKIHREAYDRDCPEYLKATCPYRPPEEDTDGWSQWQAWSFMAHFGAHMSNGMNNCCETEIKFITESPA
jgi:hypothetical protein